MPKHGISPVVAAAVAVFATCIYPAAVRGDERNPCSKPY